MVDIFSPLIQASAGLPGGQPTVFNVSKDISTNQLNKQMQVSFQNRIATEVKHINDSFSSNLNGKDLEVDSLTRYRADLSEGLDTISNTFTRLEGALNRLDTMIINVNKAQGSVDDPETFFKAGGYAATHDSYFRQLDDLIQNTRTADNLLSSDTSSVRYPVSVNGSSAQIYGNNLTPKYHIEDSDGNKWYPDQKTKLLRVYTDYPHKQGKESSSMIYDQGIQLDSFAGDQVSFTTDANGASPKQVTGTINREGVGVLNSWLYDGLATSEGRKNALKDLNAAKEAIKVEMSRYALVNTTLSYYDKIAATRLHGVQEERIQIQREAAEAVSEKQFEMANQYKSVQSSLAQALVVKNSYRALFAGISNDPITARLLNVHA